MTTRDYQIVNFITDFKVATTSTIAEVFFPSIYACYKRLAVMYDENVIKRTRDFVSQEYIYHVKKTPPKQLKHSLLVTDFYRELHKKAEILNFKIEPVYGDIRPDAIFGYKSHGMIYMGLLEVEISHKGFNSNKYEKFYISDNYKNHYPIMPTVFIVGDNVKLPDKCNVKYKVIKTDFSNFKL
ncbi:MAG: hypothetical protein K0S41_2041 [Anaerocolumna sp.]|nr:hypothetical protein [Anaerocolumna sp.]